MSESNGIPSSWGVDEKFRNLIDYLTSPHLDPSKFTMRNSDVLFLLWNAIQDEKLGNYVLDRMVQ